MSQDGFVLILGCETGICEVTVNVAPLAEATIIEEFEVVSDNEGDNGVSEAFLEHDKATHASIAILEGMNLLEADVKVENIFEGLALDSVVFRE